MKKQISIAFATAILTSVSAMAATTVDEPFGYSSGGALGSGGTGFTGGWGAVTATGPGSVAAGAGSLSAGPLATSGGSAVLTAAKDGTNDGTVSITRPLASPLTSNPDGSVTVQPYYLSVVADLDDALFDVADASQRQWGTSLEVTLKDTNGNFVVVGKRGGSTNWGVGSQGFAFGIGGVAFTSEPTLLVMKFTPGAWNVTSFSLWVNPDLSSGLEPATTMTGLTNIGYSFSEIQLSAQISGWLPVTGGVLSHQVDELRVGATWSDVAPVPEPTSVAVLGVAGLLALRRRSV